MFLLFFTIFSRGWGTEIELIEVIRILVLAGVKRPNEVLKNSKIMLYISFTIIKTCCYKGFEHFFYNCFSFVIVEEIDRLEKLLKMTKQEYEEKVKGDT